MGWTFNISSTSGDFSDLEHTAHLLFLEGRVNFSLLLRMYFCRNYGTKV